MWSLLSVLALFVGAVSSSPRANQFVDNVLNNALRQQIKIQRLDPATLANFSANLVDYGQVKGKVQFSYGTLTGLSHVRRYSECLGPSINRYRQKYINCTIAFDNLKVNYNGALQYGQNQKFTIRGYGDISTTVAFMEVVNLNMRPTLTQLLFRNIGNVNVKYTSLGPLNRFTNKLVVVYQNHLRNELSYSIAQRFQHALSQAVGMVPMPN